jgi:hypothetical protein
MKPSKLFSIIFSVAFVSALLVSPAVGGPKQIQQNKGAAGMKTGAPGIINHLPVEALSLEEELGLVKMREEEKLARDVYAALYNEWQKPVFKNISMSEQRHMNAVKILIDKYELLDPVTDPTAGVFTAPEFTALYQALVEQGSTSLVEALMVGAAIEDMDIYDLQELLAQTDNQDITAVYENLLRGSRNHLRAFAWLLSLNGVTYEPQYISQEELDEILTSPRETGVRAGNNNAVKSGNAGPGTGFGAGTGECLNP